MQRVKEELGTETTDILAAGCNRSVVHSVQGTMYNYATDTLIDHGFDVQDIPENIPFVVWYADDDEDCPSSHGEYLASGKLFKKCTKETTRVWTGYGHIGGAFLEHPLFLQDVMKALHAAAGDGTK